MPLTCSRHCMHAYRKLMLCLLLFTRDDVVSQRLKFGSAFLLFSWESKMTCFFNFPVSRPVPKNCVIFIGCNFKSRESQVGLQKLKKILRQQTVVSKEGESKITA